MTTLEIPAAIAAERQRHTEEGWSDAHDDRHNAGGEMFTAACLYWQHTTGLPHAMRHETVRQPPVRDRTGRPVLPGATSTVSVPAAWPWAPEWWKPKSKRRDLERAGALCLAERDRLRRLKKSTAHCDAVLGFVVQAYNALPEPT